jgi:nicotinamidase-related amidase
LPARDAYRQNTLFRLRRTRLIEHLRQREADALIASRSETDVCVLATVLDAVDIGYRVIVVCDAIYSSSDKGHDMLMRLYHTRYTEQIETQTPRQSSRGGNDFRSGVKPLARAD